MVAPRNGFDDYEQCTPADRKVYVSTKILFNKNLPSSNLCYT